MASLRESGKGFIVCFRFSGQQYNRAIGTDDPKEAEARRKRVDATLHDLRTGRLTIPEDCPDVATFILSDGKATARATPVKHTTLKELWERYRAETPETAKEGTTRLTERIHFSHLFRHLGEKTAVPLLTTADLQRYIGKRSKEDGIRGETVKARTIKKELATLRAVWNGFALSHKIVKRDFKQQFGTLVYGKEQSKPPFQTYEQIQRRIERNGLTVAQQANLWDCLFLDETQVEEVLTIIRQAEKAPVWLYPMALCAAHTGARRGELLRSEPDDFDTDTATVQWREKKKDKDREFTYRAVRMSSRMAAAMEGWINTRAASKYTFGNVTVKTAQTALKQALAGTKYSNIRGWHLFRHSLASILAMKGTDQRIIDATLGHSTEDMRQRYRHLFPSQQQAALDSIFG